MTDADFQVAYTAHKDVLYRFAWRMTGSPSIAEDLVHDSFIALLRNPAAFDRERGTLRSFLFGITRNLALKRAHRERAFSDLDDEIGITAAVDIAGRERAAIVAEAIGLLPALQREVLILAEYEELTLDEICRAVDAELPAVKSRLHRARENLKRMLRPLLETKGLPHAR
ncbi:MAG TPA: RNA polymerase sigma factor [Bryobacteraceae bacterium]|nr:RNA polymerase sigma factor [Bryobacteraceae bacterium]